MDESFCKCCPMGQKSCDTCLTHFIWKVCRHLMSPATLLSTTLKGFRKKPTYYTALWSTSVWMKSWEIIFTFFKIIGLQGHCNTRSKMLHFDTAIHIKKRNNFFWLVLIEFLNCPPNQIWFFFLFNSVIHIILFCKPPPTSWLCIFCIKQERTSEGLQQRARK